MIKTILAVVGIYSILIFIKAIRDIIRNRYDWSIFTGLPRPIQNFLQGLNDSCKVCDGWHFADGILMQVPYLIIMALLNNYEFKISQWWLIAEWLPVWYGSLYIWFNFLYHRLLMKKQYKGMKYDAGWGKF